MPQAKLHSRAPIAWLGLNAGLALGLWMASLLLLGVRTEGSPRLNLADAKVLSVQARVMQRNVEIEAALANPLETAHLIELAVLAEADGASERAGRLYELAAIGSLRDKDAQSYVIDDLIARKQFGEAVSRIDGLLRAHPDLGNILLPILASISKSDDGVKAVALQLSMMPPWRRNFMRAMAGDAAQSELLYRVLATLRDQKLPIIEGELTGYLRELVNQKNIEQARFVWLDFLSSADLRRVKLLFDGEFSAASKNNFFDWTFDYQPQVDVDLNFHMTGQQNAVLKMDFVSAAPNANLMSQLLVLPAGKYLLRGEENIKALHSENRLLWQVRCAEKTSDISMLEKTEGEGSWVLFERSFLVPAEDCPYQKLVLRPENVGSVRLAFSGQAYYRNFSLAKVE